MPGSDDVSEPIPMDQALKRYRKAMARARWPASQAERERRREQLSIALRAIALQIARASSQAVKDRRARAQTKAHVYNHLVPLLEAMGAAENRVQQRYGSLLLAVSGTVSVALLVVAGIIALV